MGAGASTKQTVGGSIPGCSRPFSDASIRVWVKSVSGPCCDALSHRTDVFINAASCRLK